VAGEAGLGKSSLVERFASDHRHDAQMLWGACDGLATPRALAPIHEIAVQISVLDRRATPDEGSLDHHVSAILGKLGVRSRTEAVAAVFALGVIPVQTDAAASARL
jgi:GTPase SAR1 family protein